MALKRYEGRSGQGLKLILFGLLISLPRPSWSAPDPGQAPRKLKTDCDAYEGKVVKFTDLSEVARKLFTLHRTEFETEAEFKLRAAKVRQQIGTKIIVKSTPEKSLFSYDVDQGTASLDASSFATEDLGLASRAAAFLNQTEVLTKINQTGSSYILSKVETNIGSFRASSAFRNNVLVTRKRTSYIIVHDFDTISPDDGWELKLSVPEAKMRRARAKPALLIDISKAQAFHGDYLIGGAKANSPTEWNERYSMVFADILCGFFYIEPSKIIDTVNWE